MKHELKTWVASFTAIAEGRKLHDIRKELDRSFREGDTLFFREWNEETKEYTGRAIEADVTHVTRGPSWDLPDNVVVMSVRLTSELIMDSWPAEQDDPEVTRDLLQLANTTVPIERVREWTPEERRAADDWASACVLQDSDHSGVVVPPVPGHVLRDRS